MAILVNFSGGDNQLLAHMLATALPQHPVYIWSQQDDIEAIAEQIHYAILWAHPHGDLLRYHQLKAVLSIGAGVDHITNDPDFEQLLARNIPLVRMHNPALVNDMADYALYWALHFMRQFPQMQQAQKNALWQMPAVRTAHDYPIGIIGMGAIGRAIGKKLQAHDFPVSGLVRDKHKTPAAEILALYGDTPVSLYDMKQWQDFLQQHRIFINLLPDHRATDNMLNAEAFDAMPKGAIVINIARGNSVDIDALLQALDNGQLAYAVLDVFKDEPLPADSVLWHHAKIYITPHIAGREHLPNMVKNLVDNIERLENGEQAFPLYDVERGY